MPHQLLDQWTLSCDKVVLNKVNESSISSWVCCSSCWNRKLFFNPNSDLALLVSCHFSHGISLTPEPSGWPLDYPAVWTGRREQKTAGRPSDCCNSPLKTPSHKLLMQSRKHCVISLCVAPSVSELLLLQLLWLVTSLLMFHPSFFIYIHNKYDNN